MTSATDYTPSPDQGAALDRIESWFRAAPSSVHCERNCVGDWSPHTHGRAAGHPVLSVGGLAGSGKTWLVGQLARRMGIRVAYGTPTHRAAAVLRGKLPAEEAENVRTYHSLLFLGRALYRCGITGEPVRRIPCGCADPEDCRCVKRFTPCGRGAAHDCPVIESLSFTLRDYVGGHRDLLVLDEASMVDEKTVNEIRSLGVPVLLVGDHGQLPPVQGQVNPWMASPDILLEVNHRQGEASGIINLALLVRERGRAPLGRYGDGSTVVTSAKLNPAVLAVASPERLPPGVDTAIITHTNRMRAAVNRQFHGAVAASNPALPLVAGDRVVCLENGQLPVVSRGHASLGRRVAGWGATGGFTFAFNGTVGTVEDITPPVRLTQPWRDAVIRLDADERGRPDTRVLARLAVNQLGADHRLRPDERSMAHALWDYAYALTAHKAQGSEFRDVVVLDTGAPDYRRWAYTAFTRARDRLVVVNWNAR